MKLQFIAPHAHPFWCHTIALYYKNSLFFCCCFYSGMLEKCWPKFNKDGLYMFNSETFLPLMRSSLLKISQTHYILGFCLLTHYYPPPHEVLLQRYKISIFGNLPWWPYFEVPNFLTFWKSRFSEKIHDLFSLLSFFQQEDDLFFYQKKMFAYNMPVLFNMLRMMCDMYSVW